MQIKSTRINFASFPVFAVRVLGAHRLIPMADYICDNGVTYSLENDGFCCGLGGVYKLPYPVGTGEAWLIVNDQVIQTMPRFAVRFCRAVINHARGILSLHRIHADVESHMEQNLRWAELCGFEKESVMKNFLGVGKNVTRMVIV